MSIMEGRLIEPMGVAEFYVDGFDGYEIRDGIVSCLGYRTIKGVRQAVVRLVMPISSVPVTIHRAMAAMQDNPSIGLLMAEIPKLPN